jgi:hypothetical protein
VLSIINDCFDAYWQILFAYKRHDPANNHVPHPTTTMPTAQDKQNLRVLALPRGARVVRSRLRLGGVHRVVAARRGTIGLDISVAAAAVDPNRVNPFMWLYRDRASPFYSSIGLAENERPVPAWRVAEMFSN